MKRFSKISIIAGVLLLALCNGAVALAEGYFNGGNGDSGSSGGSCQNYYSGTGWCGKVRSWYFYEYYPGVDYGQVEVEGFPGSFSHLNLEKTAYVPTGEPPYDCDKVSSGFYISGITLFEYYSNNPTWGFNTISWAGEGNDTWDGRFIGLSKYDSSKVYYKGERVQLQRIGLPMPTDGVNKIKAIYAVPASEVEDRWYGVDGKGRGAQEQAIEKGYSGNLSEYSSFCAGDMEEEQKKQGQNYKGSAQIKVNINNSTSFFGEGVYQYEYSDSGNGGTGIRDDVITINQGSADGPIRIAAESYGKVELNGGIPYGYDEGYLNTKYALSASKASSGFSNIIISKTLMDGTVIDDYKGSGNPANDIELQAGEVYTICAINDYYSTYRSDASGYGDERTVQACLRIKYETVVAAIDSETNLTLSGNTGTIASQSSGLDTEGKISDITVGYGNKALRAGWGFTLSSSDRCLENKFDGVFCTESYPTYEAFNVNYLRYGTAFGDTGYPITTLYSPTYNTGVDGVTKEYNLLPGETVSENEGIVHYSGVHPDGSPAKNAKNDEHSSMSFVAKAESITCSINGQPIGLDNATNYGRMTVIPKYNIGKKVVVGDGADSGMNNESNPLWLKDNEEIKIIYEACIGEQIAKDKNYSSGDWNGVISDNAKLGVETTDNLLDSSHYSDTSLASDAIKLSSPSGKNIVADEVIGNTINSHIYNSYQFSNIYTNEAEIGNLGHKIYNYYEISSDKRATAQINVPYNYILQPKIDNGVSDILTMGDNVAFSLSIEKSGRENKQVGDNYATKTKPNTEAKYIQFKLSTNTTWDVLNNKLDDFAELDGNKLNDLEGVLQGNGLDIQVKGSGDIPIGGATESLTWDGVETSDDFNKLCVAVAVYPADSHNERDSVINNNDQNNALTDEAGSGAFTRIAVSCKTIGKYPTVSTEGNGIVARGSVNGSYTRYDGRDFGSWSEYGLVANEVKSFASGASIAYLDAQTNKNSSVSHTRAGKKKNQMDSPQTHGNMDVDNVGLRDNAEAARYYSQAKTIIEDIKATFFNVDPNGHWLEEVSGSGAKTYINKDFNMDVAIDLSRANDINSKTDGQVIIYSKGDISISNDVQELNAILIADGEIDTCSGGNQGSDGNKELLEHCNNPLTINGAVYSEKSIKLDRVYGGGSKSDMNLNSSDLVLRAEIFNFDPKTVAWAYSFTHKAQPLTTTYIQEISTRY